MNNVIAVRRAIIVTEGGIERDLEVRIGQPFPIEDGRRYESWRQLVGSPFENPRPTRGVDSMQALERAYMSAQVDLVLLECVGYGKVRWMSDDQEDWGIVSVSGIKAVWDAIQRDDPAAVVRCAKPLADRGIAWTQNIVGSAYHVGNGVAQDLEMAISWYMKAAEQGDGSACDALAGLYYHGWGVPQDRGLSEHYRELAKQYGFPQ